MRVGSVRALASTALGEHLVHYPDSDECAAVCSGNPELRRLGASRPTAVAPGDDTSIYPTPEGRSGLSLSCQPACPTCRPVAVYCAGGSRSSIAASLLRRYGHFDVSGLIGGFAAWRLALTSA